MAMTTIQLDKSLVNSLKENRQYSKQRSQYDEYLQKIQKAKMKQLWNTKGDWFWENA